MKEALAKLRAALDKDGYDENQGATRALRFLASFIGDPAIIVFDKESKRPKEPDGAIIRLSKLLALSKNESQPNGDPRYILALEACKWIMRRTFLERLEPRDFKDKDVLFKVGFGKYKDDYKKTREAALLLLEEYIIPALFIFQHNEHLTAEQNLELANLIALNSNPRVIDGIYARLPKVAKEVLPKSLKWQTRGSEGKGEVKEQTLFAEFKTEALANHFARLFGDIPGFEKAITPRIKGGIFHVDIGSPDKIARRLAILESKEEARKKLPPDEERKGGIFDFLGYTDLISLQRIYRGDSLTFFACKKMIEKVDKIHAAGTKSDSKDYTQEYLQNWFLDLAR